VPPSARSRNLLRHLSLLGCLWQRKVVKSQLPSIRAYFGIGAESISKAVNVGNLFRSAHAFGASFVFTIGADERALEMRSDTSRADTHLPV
jgi:tRNA G18 (ribose-2'-O)-methylase SpoU